MTRSVVRLAGAAALAFGLSAALSLPAQASNSGSEKSNGTCSATSTANLSASVHKKGIKVQAKVKTDVAGEAWTYSLSDNAVVVASGDATTNEDGNFKVKTTIPNLEGTDTIDLIATDTVTGETCTAEVVVDA